MRGLASQIFRVVAIAASTGTALICPGLARAHTPEQEQACTGDAFRLCSSDIPNVDRITACMIRNKAQLSPACRVFFGPETPEAAGKPMNINPGSDAASVSAKSRKTKKPPKPRPTSRLHQAPYNSHDWDRPRLSRLRGLGLFAASPVNFPKKVGKC